MPCARLPTWFLARSTLHGPFPHLGITVWQAYFDIIDLGQRQPQNNEMDCAVEKLSFVSRVLPFFVCQSRAALSADGWLVVTIVQLR